MKEQETLFHIEWGDGDHAFVLAPNEKTAIEKMSEGKDMIRYVVKLDGLYQMIFKAGYDAGYRNVNEMKLISPEAMAKALNITKYKPPLIYQDAYDKVAHAQLNADKGGS